MAGADILPGFAVPFTVTPGQAPGPGDKRPASRDKIHHR